MRSLCRTLAAVGLGVVTALLPACSGSGGGPKVVGPGEKPTVGIVTNCTDPFWTICEAGARKGAKDFDCNVEFRQPANLAVADQMTIVNDLVRVGVHGLAVSVVEPSEQAQALKLVAKKTALITMDNDSPLSGRKCYIGVNNYGAGQAVGRLVEDALPDGGTVAVFIGSRSSANAQDRVRGVIDEIAGAENAPQEPGSKLGKYTLHAVTTDDSKADVAENKAAEALELLKATPNVCMVGLYAYNPKAILQAARKKGMTGKVKIVGFDEDAVTLDGITKGEIVGTVVQDPFSYGYKSVEVLAALARGDAKLAVDQDIAHRYVTRDGGPPRKVGKFDVVNVKIGDHTAKLLADAASVGSGK